jgi:hypothetical protein
MVTFSIVFLVSSIRWQIVIALAFLHSRRVRRQPAAANRPLREHVLRNNKNRYEIEARPLPLSRPLH